METDQVVSSTERVNKIIRVVKRHEVTLGEIWEKIAEIHEVEAGLADEAIKTANRALRMVTRLQKRLEELENKNA